MPAYATSPFLIAGSGAAPGGGAASLPGSSTGYSSTYGGIPNEANPVATAGSAIAGDIGNLGGIYGIAGGINALNENQLMSNLMGNIPGYSNLISQEAGNTSAELSGNLPSSVINLLQEQGAERGVATGSPGSPNSAAAYLRALGLTSLQEQQQGAANLSQMISQTPNAPLFNPDSLLVTPAQQQEAQQQANVLASAPVPQAAALEAQSLAAPPDNPLPWWADGNPAALYGPGTVQRGNTFYTPATASQQFG